MIKRNKDHGNIADWGAFVALTAITAFLIFVFSAKDASATDANADEPTQEEAQSIQQTLVMKVSENEITAAEANYKANLALEKIQELIAKYEESNND